MSINIQHREEQCLKLHRIYIDTNSHKLVKQAAHTYIGTYWSLQAALNKSLLFDYIH